MDNAVWLLIAFVAGIAVVAVLRRWSRSGRRDDDGGFYAADRRRDDDHDSDGGGGD